MTSARLSVRQFGDRHAEPWRDLAVQREIALAQAEVDVVGTDATHGLVQQVQFFDGRVRGGDGGDAVGAVLVLDVAQAVGHVFERGLPVGFLPLAALLDHRLGQAVGVVQRFVRETVLVRQPAFVDRFVFQRQHAHDVAALDLDDQVRAQRIVRRDRLAARQFPWTGRVAEWLAGQRADRAQVDHVARHFRVDGLADERRDFGVLAAAQHAEFHDAGHFLAETHATGALDAARSSLPSRSAGPLLSAATTRFSSS